MNNSLAAIPGTIGALLHVLVLVTGLVLVVLRVRGRTKQLGVAGLAILLAVAVLRPATNFAIPAVAHGSAMSVVLVIQVVNLFITLVDLVGIALLVGALIAGSTGKAAASDVSAALGPSSPGPRLR